MRQLFLTFIIFGVFSMNVHNRLCAQGEVGPTLCDTISPWNPDYNCNGIIDIGDALPFFDIWATSFTPDTAIAILENLDPDPTNELQWLLLDSDTLRLMLADSTIYSSVYIGGADGADGANGLSAYELWLEAGNSGSVEDFLASLIGATGADGINGADGVDGTNGVDGADGAVGLSAYEIWIAQGNTGSESDFLAGLVGPAGENGTDGANGLDGADGAEGLSAYDIWLAAGNAGSEADFLNSLIGADGVDGANGADGIDGADGLSAYEIWLNAGNVGSEAEFLVSLVGQDGADGTNGTNGIDGHDGTNGLSAYEIWLNAGNVGSETEFLASLIGQNGADGTNGTNGIDGQDGSNGLDGADGLSAYEIWLNAGNVGSETEFLASLVGQTGPQGDTGATGPEGPQGNTGETGAPGLSAYQIWLELGNEGTEQDFINYLSGGGAFSPSVHGVFDSETDGNTFVIQEAITTVSIELWGTSGGTGGDLCGQTLGASSCNLCDASGGSGGRALKLVSMVYNLAQGDVLELHPGEAGTNSEELLTCNPGLTGWTNWDCGPASLGEDGGMTQLLLNGEVIAEIIGATGGTGACIGCAGDGCFPGSPGADGTTGNLANWMTVLSSSTITEDTGSRLILRY